MEIMDFTPFKNHLEFLGYKTREERNGNVSLLFAEGSSKANFNLSRVDGFNFMVARSNWSIGKVTPNIYEVINTLNEKAVNISSVWFYMTSDNKPALGISSAYFGDYNKETFAELVDAYLADITRVLSREETKTLG